jgi:hypothetical protein
MRFHRYAPEDMHAAVCERCGHALRTSGPNATVPADVLPLPVSGYGRHLRTTLRAAVCLTEPGSYLWIHDTLCTGGNTV